MIDTSREYAHTGIPTFMKSEYGSLDLLEDYQVGVFGVPIDISVSNRSGTRLGPAGIRQASTYYNPSASPAEVRVRDLYQQQKVVKVALPSILDLGDVTIYPTEYQRTLDSIEHFSYEVRKKAFPLVLGGDHSITHPVLKGISRAFREDRDLEIGIIHFDSHPDIWDSYATLSGLWHGSPFRRLLEEGVIKGDNLVMIGDRSWLYPEEWDFVQEHGINLFSISDVWEQGMVSIIRSAIEHLNRKTDGVYLSLDIDVFDPCYAPGTGTPEPGGLTPREMIQALNLICSRVSLLGLDVVEVAPNLDPTAATQNLAAFLLHRILMLARSF